MNAVVNLPASIAVNPFRKKRYLLVGCGNNHSKRIWFDESPERDFSDGDLVTWDIDPDLKPSIVHDMNVMPYPFEDHEFDEVHAYECLEHCGRQGDGKFFFDQFHEFWRMLRPNGLMMISVPMWNTEAAWGVPDHCRIFTPGIFGFLEPEYYENVGKPLYGDYRKLLRDTNFKVLGHRQEGQSLYVVLRARK